MSIGFSFPEEYTPSFYLKNVTNLNFSLFFQNLFRIASYLRNIVNLPFDAEEQLRTGRMNYNKLNINALVPPP